MRCWEEIEHSMYEPQSYYRLRWGCLSGFRSGGGRMGAYGMLQSCWRCQYLRELWAVPTVGALLPTGTTGAAYWVSLLQRPQSIVGPSESVSQWIIYVHAPTCQRLYDTLFLRCTVRRFRGETKYICRMETLSLSFVCGSHELQFGFIHHRPCLCLPSQPQSDCCFYSLIEMQKTRRQTPPTLHPPSRPPGPACSHLATPHNTTPTSGDRMKWRGLSVGLKIEIASAPLIYFISIGTHLHSWELMARISMNVKAGCCAVMHLSCSALLPWIQGGGQLQQIDP